MPDELFKLAALAIIFGTGAIVAVAGMITGTIKHRMKRRDQVAGSSLTGTELRAMITEAVSDATDPLYEKVNGLERDLAAVKRRLPASDASSSFRLDLPESGEYEESAAVLPRQRSRT